MSPVEETLCPECNGPMVSRTSQYGTFWGCKNYPKCKGTRDSMGRSKAERDAKKSDKSETDESSTSAADRLADNDKYRFRRE